MERKFKITIPEPCTENWDKMTPNQNGRFCMSCSKTVIDFTSMLPNEVQHFFIQNQNQNICGRFKNSQLETITIQIPSQVLYSQIHYHKMFLLALFIAMGTTLFSCQDKNGNKQKIDKVEVVDNSSVQKGMTTGEPMAVKNDDCSQNPPPPPPPHKNSQKDPKISYPQMTTGEIVPIDASDKTNHETIDYNMAFNTATLDVVPFPDGGMNTFYSFLRNNISVPNTTEKFTGKIYISFVIEKDGTLSTFKIRNGAETDMAQEALRVLKMAPKWNPGKLNNHVVRTSYSLPITFK